jgi:hypothetical protein
MYLRCLDPLQEFLTDLFNFEFSNFKRISTTFYLHIILKNIDEFDINVLRQYIKTRKTPYLRMCL